MTPRRTQILHEGPGGGARVGIHPCGGLVEEQQRRAPDERQRERQALLLSSRHATDEGVARVVEPDRPEQADRVVGLGVVRREELQCLERTDSWVEPAFLEHHPHPGAQSGAVAPRIEPEHPHLTGVGAAVALEDLHCGGLPGTVRAQQPEHLALADLERQAVDGAASLHSASRARRLRSRAPSSPAGEPIGRRGHRTATGRARRRTGPGRRAPRVRRGRSAWSRAR